MVFTTDSIRSQKNAHAARAELRARLEATWEEVSPGWRLGRDSGVTVESWKLLGPPGCGPPRYYSTRSRALDQLADCREEWEAEARIQLSRNFERTRRRLRDEMALEDSEDR